MNRTVNIFLLIATLAIGVNLMGQQATGKTDSKSKSATGAKLFVPRTFLGRSDMSGGTIKKEKFDELLHQGITSRDSMGNSYKVIGFQFSYGERSYYEDSLGNPIMTIDYAYEYCVGDTISPAISAIIYDRSKAGDTIYFDRVSVVRYDKKTNQPLPDNTAFAARPMKFAIVK